MVSKHDLHDIVEIEDGRTKSGESHFSQLEPLRSFRGNYGVPRVMGNQVVKGFFQTNQDDLNMLEKLHNDYITELRQHIPVIETQTVREDDLMYLVQPFIQGITYEQMLQQDFSAGQKSHAYQELLIQALGLITKSDKTIGIDGKPENWMCHNDAWTFIDTFPPFLIDGNNSFAKLFNLRNFEQDFANNPKKTYFCDPTKIIRRLWLKSEKFDPVLNYQQLSLEVADQMKLPKSVYRKIGMLK